MSEVLEKRKRVVNNRLRNRLRQSPILDDFNGLSVSEVVVPQTVYYAGFWMRLWAYLLDIITVFSLNLLLVESLVRFTNINGLLSLGPFSFETMLGAVIFFLYFAVMTKLYGQTIGKIVMGLRVISSDDSELQWRQVVFREGIGRFLQQAFFLLYVIYVMVAFTEKKQGIHDLIADTVVIHDRSEQ